MLTMWHTQKCWISGTAQKKCEDVNEKRDELNNFMMDEQPQHPGADVRPLMSGIAIAARVAINCLVSRTTDVIIIPPPGLGYE